MQNLPFSDNLVLDLYSFTLHKKHSTKGVLQKSFFDKFLKNSQENSFAGVPFLINV